MYRSAPASEIVRDGRIVSLHYTLRIEDGSVVEKRWDNPPFRYLHGNGNIVPGLERELANCRVGDRITAVVPPELGYGVVNPDFVKRIPRSDFPPHVQPVPGMRFGSAVGEGMVLPARVTEVGQHEVTVNFNHPLAGHTLHFSVIVLDVRDATPEEMFFGRPIGKSAGRN